jgi:O-antigen/teichoic acid export membrane protein
VKVKSVKVTKDITIKEGKGMLVMGFAISLSGLTTVASAYLLRIYISRTGNVADVGLYTAGFTIIGTYVGMIFTAMGTDYYPRLAAVAHDNELSKQSMNQQAEIALLILAPILIAFLVFINWAVILLYSTQFVAVTGMVYWAALGMFFKAGSWAVAFVFLAKGASRLFFWNEFIGNGYTLLFNILGYHFYGLTGLGFSFLITYIIYLIQVYVIAKMKYDFSFEKSFLVLFFIQFALALISFIAVKFLDQPYPYIVGVILIIISSWYSLNELEKRIAMKQIVRDFLRKKGKNCSN